MKLGKDAIDGHERQLIAGSPPVGWKKIPIKSGFELRAALGSQSQEFQLSPPKPLMAGSRVAFSRIFSEVGGVAGGMGAV
jgi:hypothetical protein